MKKSFILIIFLIFIVIILVIALDFKSNNEEKVLRGNIETITMKISSVFANNARILENYTCDGDDVSPPLEFNGAPENAKSLVLIMDDPDAPVGTWAHWIIFNISPKIKKIEENSVPKGAVQGKNSWGKNSYGGPCPPSGIHRYFFKLYALDSILNLGSNAKKEDVERAMQGHILAKGELVGLYSRA